MAHVSGPLRPALLPASAPVPLAPAVPRHGLAFVLFLAVNAALFVRPGEVFEQLLGAQIYLALILLCLVVAFPALLEKLTARALESQPISLCVLALFPAILLSLLSHLYLGDAFKFSGEFLKVLIYYLLFISLVDSPARLRTFLTCFAAFTAVVALLAIFDYHGIRKLPEVAPAPGTEVDPYEPPAPGLLGRMIGTGLFQDPNDLCVLLVVAMVLALYRLADVSGGLLRWLWLVPLALFAYGFFRTQSRGGLLALMLGMGVMIRLRYGWGRALLIGALALPVLLALLGARQLDISTSTNTGQTRIQLWSDALVMFRGAPVFGVGANHFLDNSSHVAHNSYLHAFAELGMLGGALFLGTFYLAVWCLFRYTAAPAPLPGQPAPPPREIVDPELRAMHPFLAGAVTAYATGMLTLSLNYVTPTYTMLGLAAVFLSLARARPAVPPVRFDVNLLGRFGLLAVGFLIAMQIFVRLSFQG
jgi:hypothetical protein